MSTTIDSKVVEMKFDNKQFESGVQTSMSTLQKLKQSLNLTGASKGLENVNTAAKNVNMSGLGTAVESVSMKFSALQVMGVTALANITNSAVNAGKRIVSALTIDPVMSGFEEYETKMDSIQTILANTEHQGTTLDDVTAALEELNVYADKTIYNFQQMTRNIGTFTAAGVDLDTSVQSIKGIANLAAVSGSTSQQASTAMYQLSQALAAGKVSLMDWNSVVNAGMGGKVFQDALVRTSELLKTGAKDAIDTYGSFRESLTQGEWLTTEVLTETLKQLSGAYTEAELIAQGFTEAQAAEIAKLAQTASDAATKVKTFTQLFDTLKETAQSGWATTWELMFGDFEEAKEFFTGLSDSLGGFLDGMSNYRNDLLGGVLDSNWDKLISKINEAGIQTTEFEEKIRSVAEANGITSDEIDELIEKHGSLAKAVKAGAISSDILKDALKGLGIKVGDASDGVSAFVEGLDEIKRLLGYGSVGDDVKDLQTALDKLGYSVGKCGLDGIIGPDTTAAIKEFQKEVGITVDGIAGPETLAALKKAGTSLDEIAEGSEAAEDSYRYLIDNITESGGRELFLEGFTNVIKSLVGAFKAVGKAWSSIFPAKNIQDALTNIIEKFHKFSETLLLTKESVMLNGETITKFNDNGEKLVRTFKGMFAILDIISTILGGAFKIAFNVLKQVLSAFDMNVLDLTANIGDAIVKFRDWLDSVLDFSGVVEFIVPYLKAFVDRVKELFAAVKDSGFFSDLAQNIKDLGAELKGWFASFKDSKRLSNFVQIMKDLGSSISDWFSGITGTKNIGEFIVQGLANGITNGVPAVWNAIVSLVSGLIDKFCELLGINSPSTVFIALGGFLIAGLCLGLQNGFSSVWETIQSLGSGCFEGLTGLVTNLFNFLGTVDFGTLFGGALSAGVVGLLWKFAGALEAASSPIEGVGDVLSGVGEVLEGTAKVLKKSARGIAKILKSTAKVVKSFAKVMSGVAFKLKAEGIKDLAISLGILVACIVVLSLLDPKKLWNAVGIVVVLASVLAGLAFAVSKMSSASATIDKDGAKISGVNMSIISIGAALLLVAMAVKKMGSMDADEMKRGLEGLAGVLIALVTIIGAFGLVSKYGSTADLDQLGKMMLKMSVALLLIAIVAKMVGGMEWGELGKAGAFVGGFAAFVALLATIAMIPGTNIDKLGGMMLKISAALLIMAVVAKLIASMEWGDLGKAGAFVGGFVVFVALLATIALIPGDISKIGGTLLMISGALLVLTIIAKMIGEMSWYQMGKAAVGLAGLVAVVGLLTLIASIPGVKKVGPTLLALSGSIAILAIVAKLLATMEWGEIGKALVGLAGLTAIVGALVLIVKHAGSDAPKIAGTLLALSAAIGILAIVAIALGLVKTENLKKGIIAIGMLSAMMTAMIWATRGASDCKGNLIVMTVAIGIMAAAVAALSFIDPTKLAGATAAMTILMGVFAILIKVAGTAQGAIGTLIVMTVAVGLLAGVLYLLSTLPVESTIGSAVALSVLLLAVSAAFAIVSAISKNAGAALTGVLLLTAMAIPLLAFVGILALMQNIENATSNAMLLVTMTTALTLLLLPLSLVGVMVGAAIAGIVALTAMAIPLLAFVGILALMQNIQNAEANISLLVGMMTTMTSLLLVLAIIGPFALIGVAALAGLTVLMVAIGALAVGVGALMTEFPAIQEFLNTGIPVLEQLAYGLGSIISAFAQGMTAGLPEIGANLSSFIVNAMPFISGIKMVDATAIEGAKNLAGAIIALTAADLLSNIASFLSGGTSLAQLGSDLSAFMVNALPFITMANMINPDMPTSVEALAGAIKAITGASLLESITSWLTGGSSMGSFGTQLAELATGLNSFVSNLGTFSEDQVNTVTCAANAVKVLAEAADTIPNEGGWAAKIFGENGLGAFSESLPSVGSNLASFVSSLGTFTEDQVTTVTCAANAVKALAEAADTIPNEGGWAAKIFGDNGLGAFSDKLPGVGSNLAAFVTNLGTFSEEQVNTVTCAGNAIKAMADASSNIDGQAEWAKKIFGDNGLSAFGSEMADLGSDLAAFAENLGTFGEGQIASIKAATQAIRAFASLNGVDVDDLPDFGEGIVDIGDDLSDFCTNMPSSEAITTAITNLKRVVKCITEVGDADSSLATEFTSSLKDVGKKGVDAFIDAFKDAEKDAKSAGEKLMKQVVEGVETKAGDVEDACSDAASGGLDDIEGYYNDFYGAGKYLVEGFADGITAKTWYAEAKAKAMANAAEKAAKDALDINSPSRVFRALGYCVPEGFAMGIDRMTHMVKDSSVGMAKTAMNGVRSTLSNLSAMVTSDIDTQPTIRPVIDLTDVRNGTSAISDMLAMGSSMELLANVGSINSMMNQRSQNGSNFEIVSAINKLRKDLGNIGGNTYQINGVTYDDGSNITEAVEAIVHAAKVGRRV